MKKLSEMTLEELWKLFPIQLVEPDTKNWNRIFQDEKYMLVSLLPFQIKIHHIGSTAIKGIWAKPIVDILIEAHAADFKNIKSILSSNGYICMAESIKTLDFNKGYTSAGFADKVFHIHIKMHGKNDELYFRDYLNSYPKVAKEYESLKLNLWKQYEFNRDEYTHQKTEFIIKYTQLSKLRLADIEIIVSSFDPQIQSLFWNLRSIVYQSVFNNTDTVLEEKLWENVPSYYVDSKFVRIIPFNDHINIEVSSIPENLINLKNYETTPKGMLQIFSGEEIPEEELVAIVKETLLTRG